MAKIFNNDFDFKVIEMTGKEAGHINFGVNNKNTESHYCLCDTCNGYLSDEEKVYYVAASNDLLCYDCMIDFIENNIHEKEYSVYENKHYNYVIDRLINAGCEFNRG